MFGYGEPVTVDLAVAQPACSAFSDGGFRLSEMLSSAETGGVAGGAVSGLGAGAPALTVAADDVGGAPPPSLPSASSPPGCAPCQAGCSLVQPSVSAGLGVQQRPHQRQSPELRSSLEVSRWRLHSA
jgi:hypothetical protein